MQGKGLKIVWGNLSASKSQINPCFVKAARPAMPLTVVDATKMFMTETIKKMLKGYSW